VNVNVYKNSGLKIPGYYGDLYGFISEMRIQDTM